MQLKIYDFVADIYMKLGNITRDQLDIALVLSFLDAELNKRIKQLNISEQNWFLKQTERTLNQAVDQLVSVDDMGSPVSVHLVNPYSGVPTPVEMVSFNELENIGSDGRLVCCIYGNPKRIRFSIPLQGYLQFKIRYWYETNTSAPKGINADTFIDPQFKALVTHNVTTMLLPFTEMDEGKKSSILSNIMRELIEWEKMWDQDTNCNFQYGNNRRTPYKAGRFSRANLRR